MAFREQKEQREPKDRVRVVNSTLKSNIYYPNANPDGRPIMEDLRINPKVDKFIKPFDSPRDLISEFYSVIGSANIDEIDQYLRSNPGASLYRNDFYKTPAHIILEAEKVDPTIQYQILRRMSHYGVPLGLGDKNGITPLHLAFQIQDKNIINFIVEKVGISLSCVMSYRCLL